MALLVVMLIPCHEATDANGNGNAMVMEMLHLYTLLIISCHPSSKVNVYLDASLIISEWCWNTQRGRRWLMGWQRERFMSLCIAAGGRWQPPLSTAISTCFLENGKQLPANETMTTAMGGRGTPCLCTPSYSNSQFETLFVLISRHNYSIQEVLWNKNVIWS